MSPTWTMVELKLHWLVTDTTLSALLARASGLRVPPTTGSFCGVAPSPDSTADGSVQRDGASYTRRSLEKMGRGGNESANLKAGRGTGQSKGGPQRQKRRDAGPAGQDGAAGAGLAQGLYLSWPPERPGRSSACRRRRPRRWCRRTRTHTSAWSCRGCCSFPGTWRGPADMRAGPGVRWGRGPRGRGFQGGRT